MYFSGIDVTYIKIVQINRNLKAEKKYQVQWNYKKLFIKGRYFKIICFKFCLCSLDCQDFFKSAQMFILFKAPSHKLTCVMSIIDSIQKGLYFNSGN